MKFRIAIALIAGLINVGCSSLESHTFVDDGGAIRGYDPVAYFNDSRPLKGRANITANHDGGTYHFANEANRKLFEANPLHYAPQYGGYCAYAMSKGFVVSTDPNAWTIRNDKLYLNYSLGVRKTWLKKPDEYITKGDGHWTKKLADGIDS